MVSDCSEAASSASSLTLHCFDVYRSSVISTGILPIQMSASESKAIYCQIKWINLE